MIEIKNDIIMKLTNLPFSDYVIYIKETNDEYECYLQNEKLGAINFMFGIYKDHNSIKDFIDMIESNIEDYIKIYKNDYED